VESRKRTQGFVQGVSALSLLSSGTVEMLGILHKVAASLETRLLLQEIGRSSEPVARSVVPLALFSENGTQKAG
jgi:hypothetical protein